MHSSPGTVAVNFWFSDQHSVRKKLVTRTVHAQSYYARVLIRELVDHEISRMHARREELYASSTQFATLRENVARLASLSAGEGGLQYLHTLFAGIVELPRRSAALLMLIPPALLPRVIVALARRDTGLWVELFGSIDCLAIDYLVKHAFESSSGAHTQTQADVKQSSLLVASSDADQEEEEGGEVNAAAEVFEQCLLAVEENIDLETQIRVRDHLAEQQELVRKIALQAVLKQTLL